MRAYLLLGVDGREGFHIRFFQAGFVSKAKVFVLKKPASNLNEI